MCSYTQRIKNKKRILQGASYIQFKQVLRIQGPCGDFYNIPIYKQTKILTLAKETKWGRSVMIFPKFVRPI